MFLHLHHHPTAKKSKFGKILGHQKGSTFGSVDNVFTSAPSPYGEKNPNSAKSWGIKKGQIFPECTLLLRLHHHPTAKKNPNSAKSWGIKKGQIFPHLYTFEASEYLKRRWRARRVRKMPNIKIGHHFLV